MFNPNRSAALLLKPDEKAWSLCPFCLAVRHSDFLPLDFWASFSKRGLRRLSPFVPDDPARWTAEKAAGEICCAEGCREYKTNPGKRAEAER